MIYQVYGFNFIYNGYIPSLFKYARKEEDVSLPTILITSTPHLENNIQPECILCNEVVDSFFSSIANYTHINNGNDILVSKNHFVISGNNWMPKSVGDEINGPSTIYASRFNQRAVLHGGAFYYNDKAYLIIALPGVGKSTLNAAITKYHNNTTFVTDDIISVSTDGCHMYRGMCSVNLNNDSLDNLFENCNVKKTDLNKLCENEPKTIYTGELIQNFDIDNKIKIGGVFFLGKPINDDLIRIRKLSKSEFICEALKNIKIRNSLTGELLQQEMEIINRLTNKAFAAKLNILHDYSKLEIITKEILTYIDEYE